MRLTLLTGLSRLAGLATLLSAAILAGGCASDINPPKRVEFPIVSATNPKPTTAGAPGVTAAPGDTYSKLRVGDLIIVTFSDQAAPPPRQELNIPDTGFVTLPYNVKVQAVGRTTTELERDIRDAYVPAIFVSLTVTVRTDMRWFFVDGDVRLPSRHPYTGVMTVLRAITTAGGFTDFANRKKIELRRQDGQRFFINWKAALDDPSLDLPVYPNDQIIVHRGRF